MKRILIAFTLAAALSACAPRWEPSQTPFLTPETQEAIDARIKANEAADQKMLRAQEEARERAREEAQEAHDAPILAAQQRERDARQDLPGLCKLEFPRSKSVADECVKSMEDLPSAEFWIAYRVHVAAVDRKQAHAELDRYVKTCGQNCSSLTMTDLVDAAAKADMKWNEIGQ